MNSEDRTLEERAARARAGSRRQRDVEALVQLGGEPPVHRASSDEGVERTRGRHRDGTEWAEKHLPNEHPPFVAAAIGTLSLLRTPVTRNAVLARLREQGRLIEQLIGTEAAA